MLSIYTTGPLAPLARGNDHFTTSLSLVKSSQPEISTQQQTGARTSLSARVLRSCLGRWLFRLQPVDHLLQLSIDAVKRSQQVGLRVL